MHRILSSNLRTFCEEKSISEKEEESKQFEYFVNYCIIHDAYGFDFDIWNTTSAEDDQGIDGIAFLIDGELVTTDDEAKTVLSKHKRNMDVDIFFIQAKTSENYDRGAILKFGDGVEDFLKPESTLPQGEFIKSQKKIFELLFNKIDKIKNGCPNVHLRYVCASTNAIATEIEATRQNIIERIKSTRLFFEVEFDYLGLEELTKLWKKSRNDVCANLPLKSIISFPQMKDIGQSYLTIVSAREYVENILMDEEKKKRSGIFDENVREFLGVDNPVNKAISETIDNTESQNRFAVLNNGITIISPVVNNMGTAISLTDYQIVNGCQTSSMLFENYEKLDDSTYITVRIVQVDNTDIISEIVKATNSQTKVEDTQFLAFSSLFRRIEAYFETIEDSKSEIKLHLERRLNQYRNTDIPRNRIFKLQDVCRAVESMFFDKPHEAGRNPSKMIANDKRNLTNEENKEIAYYAATLALYRISILVRKGRILNSYAIYRWHILMIIKYILCEGDLPVLTSKKKCESYCKKLIELLAKNDEECEKLFDSAVSVINQTGLEGRDIVRTPTYTQRILECCRKNYPNKKTKEKS